MPARAATRARQPQRMPASIFRLLALGCAVAAAVAAGPRAARADAHPVITVYCIEASNQPGGVDREVRHIYKRVSGSLDYTTFRLISKITHTVPLESEKLVLVPGNRQIVLRPKSITKDTLHVDVEIRKRGGRPMRVSGRLVRDGTFVVGGYPYGPGRLVFAISATF